MASAGGAATSFGAGNPPVGDGAARAPPLPADFGADLTAVGAFLSAVGVVLFADSSAFWATAGFSAAFDSADGVDFWSQPTKAISDIINKVYFFMRGTLHHCSACGK